jgi:outer membrane lipoprotein-sorting protein
MSVMAHRPLVRWVLPAGILVAVLGGGAAATTLTAAAESNLPPRSPAQLLVDVQTARLDGASGTVVKKADLGLPELPGLSGRNSSSNLNTLLSGSHTLRVWYSGPDKARIALLGALGESDIIQNGSSVWIWSSESNTANRLTLPKEAGQPRPAPTGLPATPQAAADLVLKALDPSTAVTVDPTGTVAGRPVYTLVLTPKDTKSLVDRVVIGIDGTQHVPLQVQVFAKGYESPAFKIGFTDVSFTRPDASRFAFTPPPGAKVSEVSPLSLLGKAPMGQQRPKSAVIGKGWTSVFAIRLPEQADVATGDSELGSVLGTLRPVQGPWGSGRLLTGRLFSVLFTDDGRVLAGAVSGDQLTAAAADPAAALR